MNPKTAREVIRAYDHRSKGSDSETFVDRTRRGHYLEINKRNGEVRQISEHEYLSSGHPRYDDGLPSGGEASCGGGCPDCGRFSCVCDD